MGRDRGQKQQLRAKGKIAGSPGSSSGIAAPGIEQPAAPETALPPAAETKKSPDEKREEIHKATEEVFDEFAKEDLDQKLGRLSKGTTISAEEIATLKERFLNSREKIVNDSTDVLLNRIESWKKPFDLEKIRNIDAHIVIWGELNRMAYGKYWTPDSQEVVFGPTANPVDGTEDKTAPRAITDHVIAKPGLKNLDQLNPDVGDSLPKEEKDRVRNDRVKELARELIDQFTVHGMGKKKEGTFVFNSDLDGRTCLMLFKMAGFDVREDNVEYVEQGQGTEKDSTFQVDTSRKPRKHGFVVEGFGKILIVDHHEEGFSGRDSCAASLLLDGLKEFGLFEDRISEEKMAAIDQYMRYVIKEDNKEFSDEEVQNIFKYYTSNLTGLQRVLSEEQLFKIFVDHCKGGKEFDPYKPLDKDYLERRIDFGEWEGKPRKYKDVERFLRKSVIAAENAIDKIKKGGMVVHVGGPHGDVVIDTGYYNKDGKHVRKVGWGWDAVRAKKYGVYIIWDPERNFFQIHAKKELKFQLKQGDNIRGHYILFTGKGGEKINVTLEEILAALSGNPDYKISEDLRKALGADKEKQERERQTNIADQEKENKIKEIAQFFFADRKAKDAGIAATEPEKHDIEQARDLLRLHENQEKLKNEFSESQLKEYNYLKEALNKVYAELMGEDFSKRISKDDQKLIDADIIEIIQEDLIKTGIFYENQVSMLTTLLFEAMKLQTTKTKHKITL